LKTLLGEKEIEIAILRDLVKKRPSLNDRVETAKRWSAKGYAVRTVLRFLGVSRSTFYYRKANEGKKRKPGPGRTPRGYSIDGLTALVTEGLQLGPFSSSLFVRKRDKSKIPHREHNGFWLYYRWLEIGVDTRN